MSTAIARIHLALVTSALLVAACDDPGDATTADATTGAPQDGSTSTTGDEPTTWPGGVTLGPELDCDGIDAAPQLVGVVPESYVSLAFLGDLMIGAQRTAVDMVDVSDPTAPRILGDETSSSAASFVTVADGRVYFSGHDLGVGEMTFDQGELAVLGSVDVSLEDPFEFAVADGVAATIPSWGGISVFSLAGLKPVARPPQPHSEIDAPVEALVLADGHLFAVGESLLVYSLADLSLPTLVAEHGLPSPGDGLAWRDGRLYVASLDPGELHVVDVADPSEPAVVNTIPLASDWPARLAISGDVMVAEAVDGLRVLDLAEPSAPKEVATILLDARASGFGVHRGLLYVADGERTDIHRLCTPR